MRQPDAETTTPPPLEQLRDAIAATKRAPLLHKGEAANIALDAALAMLESVEGRLAAIESLLGAIAVAEPDSRGRTLPRGPGGRFASR